MSLFLGSRLAKITIILAFVTLFLDGVNISSRYKSNRLFGITTFTQRWDKTFQVAEGGTLVLNSEMGNIRIESWPEKKIEIQADAQGSGGAIESYAIDFSQPTSHRVVVDAKHKTFFSYRPHLDLVYHIKVPENFNLELVNGEGKVTVNGLKGSVHVHSSNGDIELINFEGIGKLETEKGTVLGQNVKGTLSASSIDGEIEFEVFQGSLTAKTDAGKLTLMSVDGNIHATTREGNIQAELEGENTGAYFFSEEGVVELQLPSDIKANIEASSEHGTASFLPAGKLKAKKQNSFRKLSGAVNGGGKTIIAKSKEGNVVVAM
ncbi:DUF4097 family beta strand repeat-containing protein [Chloroherpeton thalassium]|nr:DUF4097 family beta strand repeat-containing protein [Chloroherpeton thalassium]